MLSCFPAFSKPMKKQILSALAIIFCSAASAGPAPWYKWHSNDGDYDICAQFSPGDGWVIVKGPFQDSACKKPLSL